MSNNELAVRCSNVVKVYDTGGQKVSETIVDEDNYKDLIKYSWFIADNYVIGRVNKTLIRLHRYIMNYIGDDFIDHINNNPLDNRKQNLRIVTSKQNSRNKSSSKNCTSIYVGVSYDKSRKKWKSSITVNGETKYLGRFDDETDAAKCRDIATKEHFGEHGNLNFES